MCACVRACVRACLRVCRIARQLVGVSDWLAQSGLRVSSISPAIFMLCNANGLVTFLTVWSWVGVALLSME